MAKSDDAINELEEVITELEKAKEEFKKTEKKYNTLGKRIVRRIGKLGQKGKELYNYLHKQIQTAKANRKQKEAQKTKRITALPTSLRHSQVKASATPDSRKSVPPLPTESQDSSVQHVRATELPETHETPKISRISVVKQATAVSHGNEISHSAQSSKRETPTHSSVSAINATLTRQPGKKSLSRSHTVTHIENTLPIGTAHTMSHKELASHQTTGITNPSRKSLSTHNNKKKPSHNQQGQVRARLNFFEGLAKKPQVTPRAIYVKRKLSQK